MATRKRSVAALLPPVAGEVPARVSDADLSEFCTFHEEYVSRNIQLADAKAGLVLIAFSSVIALSLRNDSFLSIIRKSAGSIWPFSSFALSFEATLAWLALLLCSVGTGISFWVIVPRLSTGHSKGDPAGVTFWGDVALHKNSGGGSSYVKAVRALSAQNLVDDRLDHLFQLSCISWRKMYLLPIAMWIGGVGVLAAGLWIIQYAEHITG